MTSSQLDAVEVLARKQDAGVYRANEDSAREAFNAAASIGYNAYRIDLGLAVDKTSLLRLLGRSLRFPEWYGENWDSLADCLGDMSWEEADGYVLILQRIDALRARDSAVVDTFFDVLADATDTGRETGVPMWVLVIDDKAALRSFGEQA